MLFIVFSSTSEKKKKRRYFHFHFIDHFFFTRKKEEKKKKSLKDSSSPADSDKKIIVEVLSDETSRFLYLFFYFPLSAFMFLLLIFYFIYLANNRGKKNLSQTKRSQKRRIKKVTKKRRRKKARSLPKAQKLNWKKLLSKMIPVRFCDEVDFFSSFFEIFLISLNFILFHLLVLSRTYAKLGCRHSCNVGWTHGRWICCGHNQSERGIISRPIFSWIFKVDGKTLSAIHSPEQVMEWLKVLRLF